MGSSSNNDSVNDSMQSISDLILQNNDGDCIATELQETDINNKIVQFDNVAMNIQNSSDVIIGPVTQFNGPVTIYQNGPAIIENDSKFTKTDSTDTQSSLEKPSIIFNKRYIKYGIIPVFLLILLVTIVTIVMLVKNDNGDSTIVPDDDSHDNSSLGTHKVLTRREWGGYPQRPGLKPLPHPTKLVIISHTVQSFCNTTQQCSMRVKSAQEYHISQYDSPDIGYNFLIGGDGNVYVGRGWDYKNFHGMDSIGLSFIGNYIFNELTDSMIECALMLLESGLKQKKLDDNYKIVGHNQTFATLSPGGNVYKIIKHWPHFSPDLVDD